MTDQSETQYPGDDDSLLEFVSEYEAFQRLSDDSVDDRVLNRVVQQALDRFREVNLGNLSLPDPDSDPGPQAESELVGADSLTLPAQPNDANLNRDPPVRPRNAEMPTRLGDYELIRKIGAGGMGVVWEARHHSLGDRRFALKTLRQGTQYNQRALKRFVIEARVLAQLDHDHIVPVNHIGQDEGTHYFVMKYIEGGNLARLIRTLETAVNYNSSATQRDGQRSEEISQNNDSTQPSGWSKADTLASNELIGKITKSGSTTAIPKFLELVVQMGIHVAEALNHAHEMNVVHRDIKPANLLLDTKGNAWVADFGLAQVRDATENMTETGALLGTKPYMSPEQVMGTGRAVMDGRTDIYSLGVTLYELLTLTPAFPRNLADGELLHRIQFEDPPPARQIDPRIPRDLETILMRSMRKRPDERYQSADALAADLRKFANGEPIPHGTRPTLRERGKQWARTHRQTVAVLTATAATTLVALFGLAGFAYNAKASALETQKKQTAEIQKQKDKVAEERDQKTRQLNRSEGLRLASHALLHMEKDPMLAAMMGKKAFERYPGMEANNAILTALDHNHTRHVLRTENEKFDTVAFRGDGERLLTTVATPKRAVSQPNGVFIWDVGNGELLHELKDGKTNTSITSAVYSPDDRRILTSSSSHDSTAKDDIDGKLSSRSPRLWADVTHEPLTTFKDAFLPNATPAVFSPRGQKIVLPSVGHNATIYDCISGDPLLVLKGHRQRVLHTAYSPTGDVVATASADNTVRIWDAATGTERYKFTIANPTGTSAKHGGIGLIAFRPDGRQLAVASRVSGVQFYDVASGEIFPAPFIPEDSAQYLPNGMRVLTHRKGIGRDARTRFSMTTQLMDRTKRRGRGTISQALLSPNARWLAMHGAEDVTELAIWDQPASSLHADLHGHRAGIKDVAFSADSKMVASVSRDATARIWYLDNGRERATFSTRTYPSLPTKAIDQAGKRIAIATGDDMHSAKTVSFEPQSKSTEVIGRVWMPRHAKRRFVATERNRLTLFDLEGQTPIKSVISSFGWFWRAAINEQGDRVAAYSGGQCIMLWHTDEDRRIPLVIGPTLVEKLLFTADGDRLISGTADGYLRVWDVATGRELGKMLNDGKITDFNLSADGQQCVAVTSQRTATVWDLNDFETIQQIPAKETSSFITAEYTFDGSRIVLTGQSGANVVQAWNVEDAEFECRLETGSLPHVALHPSENEVLIASQNGVQAWNLEDESVAQVTAEHRSFGGYSHDGEFLFASSEIPYVSPGRFRGKDDFVPTVIDRWKRSDTTKHDQVTLPMGRVSELHVDREDNVTVNLEHRFGIAIHDVESHQLTRTLPGHLATVSDLAFNSRADKLVSVSHDRRVILWNLDDAAPTLLEGHGAAVTKLAWSDDDRVLLTGDQQGQVIRWDPDSGKLLSRWTAGRGAIRQLAVQADNTQFLATTAEGKVYIHDFALDQPISFQVDMDDCCWAEYSPDGSSLLVIPGKIKTIMDLIKPIDRDKVYRVLVSRLDATKVFEFSFDGPVMTSHFHPDSEHLVTLTQDGKVTIHHVESETVVQSISHQGTLPLSANVDATGEFLAVTSTNRLNVIRLNDRLPWLSLPRFTPETVPQHRADPFLPGNHRQLVIGRHTRYQFRTVPLEPSRAAANLFGDAVSADDLSQMMQRQSALGED